MRTTYRYSRLLATVVIAILALLLGSPQFSFASNGRTHQDTTLRQAAAELGIHVGSAVSFSALSHDATYARILGQQFPAITPENEMKWASVEPQRGGPQLRPR